MRIAQFEIEDLSPAILVNVNPRAELAGQQRVPACDLKFEINAPNSILSLFGPHLRDSLYWSSGEPPEQSELDGIEPVSDKPNLRNPMLGALSLSSEYAGYELTVDLGLGGKHSNVELAGCDLGQFKIEPKEGGTVTVTFRVQCHPSEKDIGKLYGKIQQEVSIKLIAPEASDLSDE